MNEIEVNHLEHNFGSGELFGSANFKIKKGEKWVLIGPSGQGKSTLLKILAGIIRPLKGTVLIKGKNVLTTSDKEKDQILRKMGMLFQKNALFDSLTVFENVAFPLRETTNLSPSEVEKRVTYYLKAVGLDHVPQNFPDEISGGMQKRLGIARALALEPEIIFYDDPTAGLDPITSRKIIDLILELQKKNNSTVVAITNDMNRAYQMADQIAFIYKGQLVQTGSIEETKRHKDPCVQQFIKGITHGPLTAGDA